MKFARQHQAPASAFQAVPAQHHTSDAPIAMLPLDHNLLPEALASAFGLPSSRFDQSDASGFGCRPSPAFQVPLPFLNTFEAQLNAEVAPAERGQARHVVEKPTVVSKATPAALPQQPEQHELGPPPAELPVLPVTFEPVDHNDAKPLHKPRVVWTDELHQRFLRAIDAAGSDEAAVPTVILRLMNVSGLSRDNVASHLQKHRLGLKRGRSRKRRDGVPASKAKARRKSALAASDASPTLACASDDQRAGNDDAGADAHDAGAAAMGAGGRGGSQCEDQAGSNEQEREGSNPRNNARSCDRGEADDGSNGCTSGRYDVGERSHDGVGAGSDNRKSTCVEHAQALAAQLDGPPNKHAAHAGAGGGATERVCAASPEQAAHTPPEHRVASGVGSNGDKGSAPASGTGGSRVAGSRATIGSAINNLLATADGGSGQLVMPLAVSGDADALTAPAVPLTARLPGFAQPQAPQ